MSYKNYYYGDINMDINLSMRKLQILREDLFKDKPFYKGIYNKYRIKTLKKIIKSGFPQPAIVVSLNPFLVAAYSDDLDCVAILAFPKDLINDYKLTIGSKLLSLNTYKNGNEYDNDIMPGENPKGLWVGFTPNIADFLSEDIEVIERKKMDIPDEYWGRGYELGLKYINNFPDVQRSGEPLLSGKIHLGI